MGHASMRVALIYQHATTDRDAAIATALSRLAEEASAPSRGMDGATRPLRPTGRARNRSGTR